MLCGAQLLSMHRNYVFSVIVGFVAITYGSVPMYKMVSMPNLDFTFSNAKHGSRSASKQAGEASPSSLRPTAATRALTPPSV